VPVWIKPDGAAHTWLPTPYARKGASRSTMQPGSSPQTIEDLLELGIQGLWLDERLFAAENPLTTVQKLHALLHAPVEV